MKKPIINLLTIIAALTLASCGGKRPLPQSDNPPPFSSEEFSSKTKDSASSYSEPSSTPDDSDISKRNEENKEYWNNYIATSTSILIDLAEGKITNNNGGVTKEGNVFVISKAGTYEIIRSTSTYTINVNAGSSDVVNLNLNDAMIKTSNKDGNLLPPIQVLEADKVNIKVIKESYLYDVREEIDEEIDSNSALFSKTDLKIEGEMLNITSSNFDGIHTKDDLKIKKAKLNVLSYDHAIRGNDSVEIENSTVLSVSEAGDALKTSSSDISSKGNQRGTISLATSDIKLYAAADAIDAAYDVEISSGVNLEAYTDSFSPYSLEVAYKDEDSKTMYLVTSSSSLSNYDYKVTCYKQDGSDETVSPKKVTSGGGFSRDTYFSFEMPVGTTALKVAGYSGSTLKFETERLNINSAFDALRLNSSNGTTVTTSWTNYTTQQNPGRPGGPGGGPGGMDEGNTNKADYSCKGIKADNQITISGGNILVKSHDDAIHVNNDTELENGEAPLGNVIINGGTLNLYSDDDGIHADNILTISGGTINVTNSYEGIEGNVINLAGGVTTLKSSDDGINAVQKNSTALINITGGTTYLDANGDGVDSNGNITMSGGNIIATGPTNGGNGVLDYDGRFTATGGFLLAVGCKGMDQSITANSPCKSATKSISTSINQYVFMNVDGAPKLGLKITKSSQNYCAYSYVGTTASIEVLSSTNLISDNNVYYVAA